MNAKLFVAVLLSPLVTGCQDARAPLEPPVAHLDIGPQNATGRIAFVSNRDGNFEIYVMNPDGSGQTNVTNSPQPDFQPAWSPDGSRIAFSRIDENGSQNIWVMNADGSGQQKLSTVDGGEPSWSPDGSRIVFTSFSPGFTDFEIHVMNANGTGDINITNNPADDFLPSWSPDGQWIVFSSNREKPVGQLQHISLYLMRADGSDVTRLTTFPGTEFIARWSPDGTRLVFTSQNGQGIWLINRDGTGLTRLANLPGYESLGGFSPDGNYIVFDSGERAYVGSIDVYIMRNDGTEVTRLTTAPGFDANSTWGQ